MLNAIMAAAQTTDLIMVGDTTYDLEMASQRVEQQSAGDITQLNDWNSGRLGHSVAELRQHLGL